MATTISPLLKALTSDYTNKYNTQLTPEEETGFNAWTEEHKKNTGRDIKQDMKDYDLKGIYKAKIKPDPETGHLPDTYKKPNHPTISDDSIYHETKDPETKQVVKGGHWEQDNNNQWSFTPSEHNLKQNDKDSLIKYFKEKEPKSKLNVK
jgi:hypothetical protein